jgi:hypothetical protein
MTTIKLLFSKNYWFYIFSIKKTFNAILGTLGIIWLLVEPTSFFSQDLSNFFKSHWLWLLIIGAVWVIYENWPQTEFTYKLKNRDIRIQLSIGDMFSFKGDFIVPINTSFDTSFQDNLIDKNSTQGQFTIKYFKEPRYLEQDIQNFLAGQQPTQPLPTKRKGNQYRYDIGSVIKLRLENDKYAYLPAISDMNDDGIASTNFDNILVSLGTLWDFIGTKGESSELNIPILGTGKGKVIEPRETIIKAIVHSFIASTSSGHRFCDKLNIVIHPIDFAKHKVNIHELCDFLRLKCEHYEHETKNTGVGQGIG